MRGCQKIILEGEAAEWRWVERNDGEWLGMGVEDMGVGQCMGRGEGYVMWGELGKVWRCMGVGGAEVGGFFKGGERLVAALGGQEGVAGQCVVCCSRGQRSEICNGNGARRCEVTGSMGQRGAKWDEGGDGGAAREGGPTRKES